MGQRAVREGAQRSTRAHTRGASGALAASGRLPRSPGRPQTITVHDDVVTTPDPDLRHLADLIDFLPGPDDREFWALVDGKGHAPTKDDHVDYVLDKLVNSLLVLRDPNPQPNRITCLVEYLMMFFGGDHPGLYPLLNPHLAPIPLPPEILSRYWVEDLMATCWRLHVRYSATGAWAERWPSSYQGWRRNS